MMSLINLLLPEFDEEMAKTRTVLERCPEDKFTWKPHPKSWDMATLATHITNLPGWSVEVISSDSLDIAPPGSPPYRAEPASSPRDLLERIDKNIAAGRDAIKGASDEHLMTSWSLLSGGQLIFTLPRITVLRSMVMNHCIHHRAQLGIYLRLLGIPVPGIYGPSADEGGM
jgi:uncharacterized damage-inducible protein DinB